MSASDENRPQEFGDELMRLFRKELPDGFKRWWAKWGDTVRFWRVKSLARTAYEDGFEIGARAALRAVYEVKEFAASAIPSRQGGDAKQAPCVSKGSAVPKADAQDESSPPSIEILR